MGDQMVTDEISESSCFQSSYPVAISTNGTQQEKGFTILLPANVYVDGGVNVNLDLEIDQETIAIVSPGKKQKGTERKVAHFAESGVKTNHNRVVLNRVVRVPASQSDRDLVASPDSFSDSTRMDACSSHERDTKSALNDSGKVNGEQQIELCTSTVDASPICDTSSSIFNSQRISNGVGTPNVCQSVAPSPYGDDQHPSSSSGFGDEPISSFEETGTDTRASGSDMSAQPMTPSSNEGASPAVHSKRRRDRTTAPSRFCEQVDSNGKGQCRQRAILNYRYCIRHILLDAEAPYRRCQHKRKPKSKKDTNLYCTNAIKNTEPSIYCSTHMIMNGMKEPKKKKSLMTQSDDRVESDDRRIIWNDEEPQGSSQPSVSLPPIENCGFEKSHYNDGQQWSVDNFSGSPLVEEMAPPPPPQEQFRGQHSFVGNNFGPPAVQRSYSQPMHTSSSLLSVYEEPSSNLGSSSQVIEESSCSSAPSPLPQKSVMLCNQASAPSSHSVAQSNHSYSSSQVPSLSKQHPQLLAKLLVSSPAAQLQQNLRSAAPPASISPTLVARPDILANGSIIQPNGLLPFPPPILRAPLFPTRKYYSLGGLDDEDEDDEGDELPQALPRPALIQLKQKRHCTNMFGLYRSIPSVHRLCEVLDDYDCENMDLFPCGLEPSDDEDSDNEMERESLALKRQMCDNPENIAPELYLLKKRLRLDRSLLTREAQINAFVMVAAKHYPNSAGLALSNRSSRSCVFPRDRNRRCCYTFSDGRSRCSENTVPMSSHCKRHILYNIDQKLFSYCSETCCSEPVLFVDGLITNGMCRNHYELSLRNGDAANTSTDGNAVRQDSALLPLSALHDPPVESGSGSQPFGFTAHDPMSMSYNDNFVSLDQRNDFNHPSDFGDAEVSDVEMFDSVAKDLGFPDVDAMLADLPSEGEDTGILLHDRSSGSKLNDNLVLGSYGVIPDTHDGEFWEDMAQIMRSDGFAANSLTPPMYSTEMPSPMVAHSSNGSVGSFNPSPVPVQPSRSHPQPIPAACNLLSRRS